MKNCLNFLWLSAAMIFLLPSLSTAQESYLIATDDAYVRAGAYTDANFDSATAGNGLRVRASRTHDNWRKVYIKFDLSGYTEYVGQATLTLWLDRALGTGYNAITNPNADTARFYKVTDDNWTETMITWNNAPVAGDYMFTQAFRHRITADPDTMYSWDVTRYVREKYAGNKMVTFLLIDADPTTSGAGLAIDTTHGTDLRIYSHETLFYEPTLVLSPVVKPSVILATPNGGEKWVAASSHDITWLSDSITTLKLEYTTDNGGSWTSIVSSVPASDGKYTWVIPNTASAQCKVRISDSSNAAIFDVSDDVFAIIGANAPEVTTTDATNLTASSARLTGLVTPHLSTATAWFEWGKSTAYNNRTPDTTVTNTGVPVAFGANITALLPSTVYHYRAVAMNGDGTTYGSDKIFTTSSLCNGNCIIATDDAFVRAGQFVNTNYDVFTNAGDALRIRMSPADSNKRVTYIKFDLSGYTGSISSATLALWVSRAINSHWTSTTPYGDSASIYTVTNDAWAETTITWNNAPPADQFLLTHVFNHRLSTDGDTLYQWDVTSFIQTEYGGDKMASFLLKAPDTSNGTDLRIYSHETAGREPTLIITSSVGVKEKFTGLPQALTLGQNYPNPFNPATTIRFSLSSQQHVRLEILDLFGRTVATLINERKNPGEHIVTFDGGNLVSGVYFYRIMAGTARETRKMVLIK